MADDIEDGDLVEEAIKEDFEYLMGLTLDEILQQGQKALFASLVSKVRNGAASHQEAAILRNILKDNGLTLGIAPEGFGEKKQSDSQAVATHPLDIPTFEEPEYGPH